MLKIRRTNQILCLRIFQNFSFLCSTFYLGEFHRAALVEQCWLQGPHLQLHPPLLGLHIPTFLLLLHLPFLSKHRSGINHYQCSPIVVNTQSSASRHSKPALRAGSAQFTSASLLIWCQAHTAYSSTLLIRTNLCFLAGHLFLFHMAFHSRNIKISPAAFPLMRPLPAHPQTKLPVETNCDKAVGNLAINPAILQSQLCFWIQLGTTFLFYCAHICQWDWTSHKDAWRL